MATFCPDCGHFVEGDLAKHREAEHPPAPRTLAVSGIRSQERHGYQPAPQEE